MSAVSLDAWADRRPVSDRWARGSGGVAWRPAWKFKGDAEGLMAHMLEQEQGPTVHVCSGSSRFGDVTIDLMHPQAMVRGDARQLPVRDVGAVVIDPPYHMALDERQRFMKGCIAALRPGGVLIVHAPWMPQDNRLELEEARIRMTTRGLGFPSAPVILSKWRYIHTKRASAGRWRRPPTEKDAVRARMRPGALAAAEVAHVE